MSCSVVIYLHTAPADTLPANELQLPSYMRVKDSSCQYKARGSTSMSFLFLFLLPYSLQWVTDWMTPVWRLFFHKSPAEFPISHPSFWDYQQRGSKSAKWSFSCCFLRRILNFQSLRLLLPLSLSLAWYILCVLQFILGWHTRACRRHIHLQIGSPPSKIMRMGPINSRPRVLNITIIIIASYSSTTNVRMQIEMVIIIIIVG